MTPQGSFTGTVSTVLDKTPSDVALNADATKMYIARADGTVSVYDTTAKQIIDTINVGTDLAGIDVSPDGAFLLAVEDSQDKSVGDRRFVVHKVDLAIGTITDFGLVLGNIDGPFHDVAILADGTAIVTTMLRGSGATTTYTLDTRTGSFAPLLSGSAEGPIVMSSADRLHVLLAQGSNVSGPNQIFNLTSEGAVHLDASRGPASSGNSLAAFSGDGSLAAYVERQGGVEVFDAKLNRLATLAGIKGDDVRGVAFDATADNLYVMVADSTNNSGNVIHKISTTDWSEVATIGAPGIAVTIANNYGDGGNFLVGPDSQYFTFVGHVPGGDPALFRITNPIAPTPIEGSSAGGTVTGTSAPDVLHGLSGDDTLNGGGGDDILRGGGGSDTLDGGTGHDAMYGGDGDDVYLVDDVRDVVGEASASGGSDEVRASVSYALPGNVERLTLTGTGAIDGVGNAIANIIMGNDAPNMLRGMGGDDTLSGGGGDDVLNGGTGHDAMDGGGGNDVYIVDNSSDVVTESSASGGSDEVRASASFTLANNVERLVLTGSAAIDGIGNGLDNTIIGNDAANMLSGMDGNDTLTGGDGNDVLDGGTGQDAMDGGNGDDLYFVDDAKDVVTEASPSGGSDEVRAAVSLALGNNVERLVLTGGDAIDGAGNSLANSITGNSSANMLSGMDGNDTLTGGAGTDQLTGGSGADIFRDTAAGLNGDTITDFAIGDRINLSDADATSFQFGLNGGVLTYTGGSVTLANLPAGRHLVAVADAGGGVDLTLAVNRAEHDFDSDGRSDILWRNDSGQLSDWLGTANGAFTDNGGVVHDVVPNSWRIAETGDFNGDGRSDILWRNDSGQISDWLGTANGGFTDNGDIVHDVVPNSWRIADTGDFNGDGRSDILWRNDSGQLSDWLGAANGGFTDNGDVVYAAVPNSWHIARTGDFNGDGRSDILWRNDSGQLSDWLGTANGGFTDNGDIVYAAVPNSWHIAKTGDFNGDGRSDILWRNDSGQLSDWLGTANGGFTDNGGVVHDIVPNSWHIADTGDFNGDGRSDILWRNDSGQLSDWLGAANGGFTDNGDVVYAVVPNSWHVQL